MNGTITKTTKRLAAAAIAAGAMISSSAHAAPGFSLGVVGAGGMGINKSSAVADIAGFTVNGTATPGLAVGAGLAAEVGPFSAEALYMSRKFTVKTEVTGFPPAETSSTSQTLDIPVMFRFGLGGVSVGAGAFYSLALKTGGDSTLGLTGGGRIKAGPLFIDARLNYTLNKVDNGLGGTFNPIEALALVGFNFL